MGLDQKKVKEKKKSNGEKKERKKTPWKAKQAMRVERALKSLTKLAQVLVAAKAPNIEPSLAQNALTAVTTLKVQVDMLPGDWKPAKGATPGTAKKVGVGSFVMVKPDLGEDPSAATYKYIAKELFTNAEVVGDDGRYWMVKCADGQHRVLKKKHAAKYVAPVTATPATATA